MALSPAAKVGAVTLAAIAACGFAVAWLTNFSLTRRGYEFDVIYGDVAGLRDGAALMLMGVRVGTVERVVPHDRMVQVHVHVDDQDTTILRAARFKIMSQGLVGEKSLEIFPPRRLPATVDYVTDGEQVRGDDPQRLELVMEEITDTFEEFRRTADPERLRKIFDQTAQNLLETTEAVKNLGRRGSVTLANIDALLADTNRLVVAADPAEVRALVADARALSNGLRGSYESLFGTPERRAENQQAIANLRSVARQLDQLSSTLNKTVGDPVLQRDLRDVVRNVNTLVGSFTATAETAREARDRAALGLSPRLQGVVTSSPVATGLAGNLGLRVNLPNAYADLGLEQIGEGNFVNLLFGDEHAWDRTGYQVGLVRSKIGVGLNHSLTDSIMLTGQLYDPFRPTVRLGGSFFPGAEGRYGLMAQWAREITTNQNLLWVGLEYRPLGR